MRVDEGGHRHRRHSEKSSNRLPTNVRPVHYELCLEPDIKDSYKLSGTVSISLYVLQATKTITLHAANLDIHTTNLVTEDGDSILCLPLQYDLEKEMVTIELENEILAPTKVRLEHGFNGSLLDARRGFFVAPTGARDTEGREIQAASTIFEPIDARRAFPCFDEPALKARFTVTLIAEKGLTCLSNMPVATETHFRCRGKEKKSVTFCASVPMSTYLVAFAVGDFQFIETNKFRVPIRIYATANRDIRQARPALEYAAMAMKYYEETLQIPFSLPKMDLLATPGMQVGAVENWGLISFGEGELLFDILETTINRRMSAIETIFHELAHQWFGNVVTMSWWNGLWLNEGFATWASLEALSKLKPEWQSWEGFLTDGPYVQAMEIDGRKSSHAVEMPIKKDAQITLVFDGISYGKGAALLRMLSSYLGEEVFLEGVRRYLRAHILGSTDSTELWDFLSEVSGEDISSLMYPLVMKTGYPVVAVEEEARDSKRCIMVTQNRYLGVQTPQSDRENSIYPILLTPKLKDSIAKDMKLYERNATFRINSEFLKLNSDQIGFYRVSYSPSHLSFLRTSIFTSPKLYSTADKIGIISDALAMSSSGYHNTNTSSLLDLLSIFQDETNYFIWRAIIAAITALIDTFTFSSTIYSALIRFRTKFVHKCLLRIGWSITPTDSPLDIMLKPLIFSASSADPTVRIAAKQMFRKYTSKQTTININLLAPVLATVLTSSPNPENEYNSILSIVPTSTPLIRPILLSALGLAPTSTLINHTLSLSLSPSYIATRESYILLNAVTTHRLGRISLWDWFKSYHLTILKLLGNSRDKGGRIVELCTSSLGTREQLQDVREWFADSKFEMEDFWLGQALERIQARVEWAERGEKEVEEWLKTHGFLQ